MAAVCGTPAKLVELAWAAETPLYSISFPDLMPAGANFLFLTYCTFPSSRDTLVLEDNNRCECDLSDTIYYLVNGDSAK